MQVAVVSNGSSVEAVLLWLIPLTGSIVTAALLAAWVWSAPSRRSGRWFAAFVACWLCLPLALAAAWLDYLAHFNTWPSWVAFAGDIGKGLFGVWVAYLLVAFKQSAFAFCSKHDQNLPQQNAERKLNSGGGGQ